MGIGRSPRKLLKASLDSLDKLEELRVCYPEAAQELQTVIGVERLTALDGARTAIRDAFEAIEAGQLGHNKPSLP